MGRTARAIHGMMLVKDEADILPQTLAAASWCDRVYVLDNGSTDGSWELVNKLAARDPRIVPFGQLAIPFSTALRGELFRRYQPEAETGDWWCVLDADEIYIDDPRTFLAALPDRYGEVWGSSYQYYFTDRDLDRYEADPAAFLRTGVPERLRHYLNNWSESRFFRHHPRLVWPPAQPGRPFRNRPLGLGAPAPRRIRLKHYQYRSPQQIQRRLDARAQVTTSFTHERRGDWLASVLGDQVTANPPHVEHTEARPPNWRDRIVPADRLHYDAGDGRYISSPQALPPIPHDPLRGLKHRAAAARWRLIERLHALREPPA